MTAAGTIDVERTWGEPARLDAATAQLQAAQRPLRAALPGYRAALRRLADTASDVAVAIADHSPALDHQLDDLAGLARMPAAFATALRQVDRYVPDTPDDRRWLATSDRATFDAIVAAALDRPNADPAQLWASTPETTAARARLLDLLAGGPLGVTTADLDAIVELVQTTPAPVVDGLVHGLTDVDLARLVVAAESRWPPWRGWRLDRRHRLWTALGRKVGRGSWDRLAALTDDLDPPPATLVDGIAADEDTRAFAEEMVYGDVGRWLTWRAERDDNPIAGNDLTQGRIGNCYLIASIIGVANRDPDLLRRMITRNPNGTYTVRFFDGVEVTVSPTVPIHPDAPERPAFASRWLRDTHRDPGDASLELWPLLLEKAYAQRHGGWGRTNGGWPGVTIQELVGGSVERLGVSDVEPDELRRRLEAGEVITFATLPDEQVGEAGAELYDRRSRLVGQHAYVLEQVTPSDALVLINPWDPNRRSERLTMDEARQVGWRIEANQLP